MGLNPSETISSRDNIYMPQGELRKLNLKNWPYNDDGELDPHRPYIDHVELKCRKCGGKMGKIPDLIDVWFDSGAMPYASFADFPADFIAEAIDQTRGWFYTLLAISTLLDKGHPYKNVISHGHVLDEKGQKMSKSKGNTVSPFEVMDKFGADAARWYFYTINSPAEPKLFSMKDVQLCFQGFITTLDNCVRFWELYNDNSQETIDNSQKNTESSNSPLSISYSRNLLDKWVLSKLSCLILEASENLDNFNPTSAARAIEKFVVEDLSNWWLRRSRKRKEALGLLRLVLLELAKVIAPFTPFIAEDVHKRLHKGFNAGTDSVHLHNWPKADKKLIDKKLE